MISNSIFLNLTILIAKQAHGGIYRVQLSLLPAVLFSKRFRIGARFNLHSDYGESQNVFFFFDTVST